MLVTGKQYHTVWVKDKNTIQIIDQRRLPHEFVIEDLKTVDDIVIAIKDMHVRGAPLIGVTAAFGMYLACLNAPKNDSFDNYIKNSYEQIKATRPTAIDLLWALEKEMAAIILGKSISEKIENALKVASEIREESIKQCKMIGGYGLKIIKEISEKKKGNIVNILTHCNAGWLATVDYGTATSPIYAAFEKGIKIHVWVDETRPRNQGLLTAWELSQQGIPHTIIADNTGGYLMRQGMVDMVIVGSDRTTFNGDVTNKIGTYLKALAAKDNNIPFYVALPSSSIDWKLKDSKEIPIEQRNADEINYVHGIDENGKAAKIRITPKESPAVNYAFDITPSRLVTALITERGVCKPNKAGILTLFPEKNG